MLPKQIKCVLVTALSHLLTHTKHANSLSLSLIKYTTATVTSTTVAIFIVTTTITYPVLFINKNTYKKNLINSGETHMLH